MPNKKPLAVFNINGHKVVQYEDPDYERALELVKIIEGKARLHKLAEID